MYQMPSADAQHEGDLKCDLSGYLFSYESQFLRVGFEYRG